MNASTLSLTPSQPLSSLKGRVLCVDDEPNILRALSWLLKKDFQVVTAASAQEGLVLVKQGNFDVIISDQRMPEMSGVEFLREVKTLAPRAMRILLTGYSDMQAVLQSVNESEVFRFVPKPWDVVELPQIVSQAAEIARRQELAAATTVATPTPPPIANNLPKILVLDEDEATHSAIELSVGDLAEIVHVTSPVDAFKMLEDEEIGIIVSERKLGTMDLTHLLCLLKRKHPQIVSVVVTETEDSNLICRMINQGQIFRFMTKPLKAGSLRLTLKSAITKRQELLSSPLLAARHSVDSLSEADSTRLQNSMISEVDRSTVLSGQSQPVSMMQRIGGLFRRLFAT